MGYSWLQLIVEFLWGCFGCEETSVDYPGLRGFAQRYTLCARKVLLKLCPGPCLWGVPGFLLVPGNRVDMSREFNFARICCPNNIIVTNSVARYCTSQLFVQVQDFSTAALVAPVPDVQHARTKACHCRANLLLSAILRIVELCEVQKVATRDSDGG